MFLYRSGIHWDGELPAVFLPSFFSEHKMLLVMVVGLDESPNLFLWVHLSWYGKLIHRKLVAAINRVQGISDSDFQVKSKQIGLKSFPLSESWVLRCAQSGPSANRSSWSPNLLATGEWVGLRFCFISGRFWYPEETGLLLDFFPGYSERVLFFW